MGVFQKYFSFQKMISLWLINSIYVIGVLAIIAWAIKLMLQGGINSVAGILLVIFGNLFWRIFCELSVVLFHIQKSLSKAEKYLRILSDAVQKR